MDAIAFNPIGIVKNDMNEPIGHHEIKKHQSKLIINEKFLEALINIEVCEYLDIVFYFHQSEAGILSGNIPSGEKRGVFASRSPNRPNPIGVSTVKLIKKERSTLLVEGLDAINNTPVLDIKSADTSITEMINQQDEVHHSILKSNPRIEINNLIKQNNQEQLLLKAGEIHGHFCPGLAMGIMAGCYAMNKMEAESDGMEDLLAITETNNCFSDGIQLVTGCSFGNNALIFKDVGKTAFTLSKRDGRGIRICSKHESQDIIKNRFPVFNEYYQKVVAEQNHQTDYLAKYKKAALERAFETLQITFDSLFSVQHVTTEIPPYAHINESIVCDKCGESVMKTRTVNEKDSFLCLECVKKPYNMLNGNGILSG